MMNLGECRVRFAVAADRGDAMYGRQLTKRQRGDKCQMIGVLDFERLDL